MRTTLNLDDELLRVLRSIADEQDRTISDVASGLIRDALRRDAPDLRLADFPVFDVSAASQPLTAEQVREALEEA